MATTETAKTKTATETKTGRDYIRTAKAEGLALVEAGAVEEVEAGQAGWAFEGHVREGSSYEGVVVSALAEGVCRACSAGVGSKGAA